MAESRLTARSAPPHRTAATVPVTPKPRIAAQLREAYLAAGIERKTKDPEILTKVKKLNVQRRMAATIISDLLYFWKRREVHAEETDLRRVLAEAVDQIEPYSKPGVALRADVEGPPIVLEVDPLQIQEVLVNLLKNAFQATAEGRVEALITDGPDEVRIIVRDTGTGMPRDVLDRIFEPFFTTKRIGEGTGLGLAMCKNIVVAHSGRIEVGSEPGKGTAFAVILPRSGST